VELAAGIASILGLGVSIRSVDDGDDGDGADGHGDDGDSAGW
jgi:hypothetical protein